MTYKFLVCSRSIPANVPVPNSITATPVIFPSPTTAYSFIRLILPIAIAPTIPPRGRAIIGSTTISNNGRSARSTIAVKGGLTEFKKIHDLCKKNDIPLWCGGMLEAGIGRAHNIAITTLSNFTLPGDTAPSSHYWKQDIIEPEVTMNNGFIYVPDNAGIGYEPNRTKIEELTLYSKTYKNTSY